MATAGGDVPKGARAWSTSRSSRVRGAHGRLRLGEDRPDAVEGSSLFLFENLVDDACRGYRTLRNQTFVRQKSCICTETEIFCTRPVLICGGGDLLHLGVTHRLALPDLAQLVVVEMGRGKNRTAV